MRAKGVFPRLSRNFDGGGGGGGVKKEGSSYTYIHTIGIHFLKLPKIPGGGGTHPKFW